MKKSKVFLIIFICIAFTYIAIEQEMGVGAVNFFAADSIPVSAYSVEQSGDARALSDAKASAIVDNDSVSALSVSQTEVPIATQKSNEQTYETKDDGIQRIVVTAAGDCILGSDLSFGFTGSFMDEVERQKDFGYFFQNFAGLFESSDLTIVNLEVPLTNSEKKADKEFAFKGLPEFVEILKLGNVDAVTIANNHTKDYGIEGYNETINNLDRESVMYFGNEYRAMTEVSGIKIGMFGYSTWYIDNSLKKSILRDIEALRDMGADLVIAYFHWGDERAELPNEIQETYAHFAIDSGVDLVLGSHPHVIQGIEEYKGKQIVYSLGNFCYGGAKNPSDKDTFVFQQTFSFAEGELIPDANIRIIPASISSTGNRNNYQPTPLAGDEYDRVAEKIINRSIGFNSAEALCRAMSF